MGGAAVVVNLILMFKQFIVVGLFIGLMGLSSLASTLTMLDHLKKINDLMCEKMVSADCKSKHKPDSKDQCVKRYNSMSEINPNNAKIEVIETRADACLTALKSLDCREVMGNSISPPLRSQDIAD